MNQLQTAEDRHNRRTPQYIHWHLVVQDRDGTKILVGDTVIFLMRSLFSSRSGVVYKISENGETVTSRDNHNWPISRAPYYLRVVWSCQTTTIIPLRPQMDKASLNLWTDTVNLGNQEEIGNSKLDHPNMKSHTGGAISFGKSVVHTKSSKQKINTKSLTEAELVGVSEYLPYHIWIENFLSH